MVVAMPSDLSTKTSGFPEKLFRTTPNRFPVACLPLSVEREGDRGGLGQDRHAAVVSSTVAATRECASN